MNNGNMTVNSTNVPPNVSRQNLVAANIGLLMVERHREGRWQLQSAEHQWGVGELSVQMNDTSGWVGTRRVHSDTGSAPADRGRAIDRNALRFAEAPGADLRTRQPCKVAGSFPQRFLCGAEIKVHARET